MDYSNKTGEVASSAMTVASKNLVAATIVALSALQAPSAQAEDVPYTPVLGNNSAYELSSVSSAGSNTITLNVYDEVSGIMKEVHYQVGLKNSVFGSGSYSKSHTIKLIDANVNVTSKYNTSAARIFNSDTDLGNINKDFVNLKSTISDTVTVGTDVVRGGAIHNTSVNAIIGNLTGDFINNYAQSDYATNAYGGAIDNSNGTINHIIGDFVGNYVKATGGATSYGGAIHSHGIIGDITGDFVGNYIALSDANATGGAIHSSTTINNIVGNFIGNHALSSADYAYGGAISNNMASINNITGDFIGNYAEVTSLDGNAFGGAIYNNGSTINDIKGDFIGNYVNAINGEGSGGAIYNSSEINSITGNFIENHTTHRGGAIHEYKGHINTVNANFYSNYVNSAFAGLGGAILIDEGSIDFIEGNFEGNHVVTTSKNADIVAHGGAIYNNGTIEEIKNATFAGNYVETYGEGANGNAVGGAIFNFGTIKSLTGQFINNTVNKDFYVGSTSAGAGALYNIATINYLNADFKGNSVRSQGVAHGGALYNTSVIGAGSLDGNVFYSNSVQTTGSEAFGGALYNLGTLANLNLTFEENKAISTTGSAFGGAIYNGKTIGDLTGTFKSNSAISNAGAAAGGALYNIGTINSISANFINNYVIGSTKAEGGAIYTSKDLLLLADSENYLFSGNYVQLANGEKDYQAIFVDAENATLTMKAINNGSIQFDDYVTGKNVYKINLTGDNTGAIKLYNDFLKADVSTEKITVDTLNNKIHNYIFNSLTSSADTKYLLDVNFETRTADTFTIGENSSGTVFVESLNILGAKPVEDTVVQILQTNSDSIQLGLNSSLSQNTLFKEETHDFVKSVVPVVNFGDEFYNYKKDVDIYGAVKLATTNSTNDSLLWDVTWDWSDEYAIVSHGDSLALWNRMNTAEDRVFNFIDANNVHSLTENMGTTSAGKMTVQGVVASDNVSTIDAQSHSMFELANQTDLVIDKTVIKNASAVQGAVINSLSDNAKTTLSDVKFLGNTAEAYGGAIYNSAGKITASRVQFEDNVAQEGSAIYNMSEMTLTDVTFSGNTGNSYIYNTSSGVLGIGATAVLVISNGNTAKIVNDGKLTLQPDMSKAITLEDAIVASAGKVGNVHVYNSVTLMNLLQNQNLSVESGTLNITNKKGDDFVTLENVLLLNKTNAILTDVNVNGGEINTASGATTEITADNYLQTLINTEILGSGTVVKNGRTDSTLVLKGDNSQFAGDFEVQAGGVRVEVDNKNKFFNNANVLVEGSSQKLDYISSEISTIANPISLDSAFSNISLKDGATFAITGAGHNASAYSINDGWLVSSEGSNNLVFSNANYLVNTDFSVGGISSNDSIYFQNSIVSFGDALKNTTNYNLGGGQYSIEDSTLNLLDNVAGNNYNFESLNLVGNNNKITIDVDLTLDNANGVVPVADTITANSGSGLVYLSDIFITGDNGILESENGQLSKGVIQIFKGANNLKVAIADNIEVGYRATNYYKYAIESATAPTSQGGHEQDSIRLVAKGITSSDTLRDLNLYNSQTGSAGGNRGFNFIVKDGLQQNNTYNIYRDLDTTTAGNFSIIGQLSTDTNEKSVLDGTLKPLIVASIEVGSRLVQEGSDWYYYEPNSNSNKTRVTDFVTFDSDGNASISPSAISDKTQGSMFELVNATNFSMENITVKNAMRYSDDTIKDGSAIYANNSNAKVSLKNVDFTNNSSAGNGGAIANLNSSSFEIKNSVMSGNTAGGKGGAIYTEADMLITDSDFGVNSLNIDNNATPNDIYIANGAKVTFATSENITNYIMSGLAGGGDFTKTGQGTLELTGHNADLTGTFTLAEGVVKYSKTLAENSFAGGNVKLASNTILEMNIAESLSDTIKNVTSLSANSGTVVKNGAGALNLNGNNSGFTGKTQINSGSLVYNAISADDSYFNGVTEIADGANLVLNILNVDNQVVSGINSVNQTSTSTATIMKNGTGTLNLVGDNSGFKGIVDINDGVLSYTTQTGNKFVDANKYDIANGAKLNINNLTTDDLVVKNLTGAGELNKSGNGLLTITGANNGFVGVVNVKDGVLAYTKADGTSYIGGSTVLDTLGTLQYTVNTGDSDNLTKLSGVGVFEKLGLGALNISGDNSAFSGTTNIKDGVLSYSATNNTDSYFLGKTVLSEDTELRLNIAQDVSNQTIKQIVGSNATVVKTGMGNITIEGDNSAFTGLLDITEGGIDFVKNSVNSYISGKTNIVSGANLNYLAEQNSTLVNIEGAGNINYSGVGELTFNASDNSYFGGVINTSGTQLNVTGLKTDSFDFGVVINDGRLNYTANSGANITIDSNSTSPQVAFGASSSSNSSVIFNGGSYNLATEIANSTGRDVTFEDATIKLGASDYVGANYTVKDSVIDLIDGFSSTKTFADLTTDNTELKLDVKFDAFNSHNSDKLIANNNGGDIKLTLTDLNIDDSNVKIEQNTENGLGLTNRINVLGGELKFDSANSVGKWATNAYVYDVKTDNQDLLLTAIKTSSEDSLRDMNDTSGVRGLQFSNQDINPYVVSGNLGVAADGVFTVNGVTGGNTIISGDNSYSIFEITGNTDLRVNNLTISNANGSEGSAILANNSNAKVTLNNVNLKNNVSAGNGGAISNIVSSEFVVKDAEISNNTASGLGGAIYTETSMEIIDSNFANNSDVNGANDIYLGVDSAVVDFIANGTSIIGSGIAGNGQFNKNGQGTLKLAGSNSDFVGTLTIKDGVLEYTKESGSSYIGGKTEIAQNGKLQFTVNNNDSADLSDISGLGVLNKQGEGTINLVGDNSGFTGNVDIDAGSLAYTSNNGSSFFNANTYEIANNAKLVIDNSIADDITIKNLSGKGSIEKSGLGTVTLSGVNNGFRGDLNVAGGMVDFIQTSANDNYILGNTYIAEDAGVSIVNSESALILGNFSGKGNLTIAGLKDVTLKGDNSGLTGDLNIEAGNLIFDADSSKYVSGKTNIANNAGLVINNTSDYQISKLAGLGTLAKNGAGALIIEGDNSDFKGNLNINNGIFSMNVGSAVGVINNATFANGTGIDLQNTTYTVTGVDSYITNPNPASIESLRFNNLRLDGNVDLDIDIDLENKIADNVYARQVSGQGNLILDKDSLNVVSEALYANTVVNVASGALIDRVMLDRGVSSVMGPIQRYNVAYENGNLMFARTSIAPGINDVNPSVMASPIAAQVGGHFMQLDVLHAGFSHMDKYTKHTRLERTIAENANKNAVVDIPLYDESDYLETTKGLWVKPYTTFESVGLKNGSSVSTTSYGSYFGADSDLVNLGKGYHGVISTFAGYNGSYQSFNGINANNNGGALGMTGTLYKGNFFTGLTASAGGSSGEANTYYGTDHYTMMTAGIANKTGYNIEINGGKLIIQPNLFLAYTFVNTFDYTNAAGVRIEQDPLHSVQIVPGIRVIGNLENHWHPYASVNMVWNVLDETKVMANDVRLPHISVKPYVEYGVGIQRLWGDCFTGYFQTMVRNGGRTGVSLSAGFRWAIGLDSDDVKVEKEPKRKVKSNRISSNSQATAPSAAKGTTECKGNTCVEFVKKVLKVKKDIIEIDSL